jgi:hypothetical protein
LGRIHITVYLHVRCAVSTSSKNKILKLTGVSLSNTKNVKSAFVAEFDIGSNMSELQLRLAGNETVRAKITSDAQHVVGV